MFVVIENGNIFTPQSVGKAADTGDFGPLANVNRARFKRCVVWMLLRMNVERHWAMNPNVSLIKGVVYVASASKTSKTRWCKKIREGMVIVRILDGIVRNRYANDPGKLAAWISASHVEKAPRKRRHQRHNAKTFPIHWDYDSGLGVMHDHSVPSGRVRQFGGAAIHDGAGVWNCGTFARARGSHLVDIRVLEPE